MKKAIVILILSLLTINLVNAAKFYILPSFKEKPEQTILIPERDAILFDYKQGRHAIVLEKFNSKGGIDVSIFVYQKDYYNNKEQSALYISLKPGMRSYIDFDRDYIDDFEVKYLRQTKNNATFMFKALNITDMDIVHEDLSDFQKDKVSGSATKSVSNTKTGLAILLGIIVSGLLLFSLITNKKR
ncbi:hypothetical protein HYX18_03100 [Candidatus Woesearchaeota archaeon]|nr:hypothetical protein [Candidatus Woesearchaeota archaeon]